MIVESNVIPSTSHPSQSSPSPSPLNSPQSCPPQMGQPALLTLNADAAESLSTLNALSAPPSERQYCRSSSRFPAGDAVAVDNEAADGVGVGSGLYVELPEPEDFSLKGPTDEDSVEGMGGAYREKGGSCSFDADDNMAGDDQRAEKYIVDIPFSVLLSIYQSLDADKGWEKLAAETGYTFDKIKLLELEGSRSQGSPSRSLLWELGSRNMTVRQLYGRLSSLDRYREMKILEDYVHNPSNPSFANNGLQGLPDVPIETSGSLKGLKSPLSKKSSSSNNSSVHSNTVNFNQQIAGSDVNISMKCQQTDKYYPGKQMPFLTPACSSAEVKRNETPPNPSSIMAPMMKPTNPGSPGIPGSSNVNLVRNMIRQMPGGAPSSGSPSSPSSSSSSGHVQSSPSASSPSSSSPLSNMAFSSSVSSLPGLESTFDVQMAFMGSACFSYSEVLQATNYFGEENKLGEGAFGKVYFGMLRKNKCAVKKMEEANGQESVAERSTQIRRELTSLLKFRHENIVTLYGYAVDGESLCLIYQFMPNGSLEDRIMCKRNTPPLIWSQRLNIMLGACQGLNFLHTMGDQPLIHGDIKSANILLDKHMEAKIGDLGQAQQANSRDSGSTTSRLTHITRAEATTKLYGTRAYQPREVQTGGRPSTKSDVFAIGVVLLEVFSGEKAFDERREGEQFLAEYFRSLRGESGDDACLSKLDRRGGECPREVCLAILNIADVCTSHLKRHRPNSVQLLQKVTEADELYIQKTGIKRPGMDSLPGSEHSCHMSHCSSPAPSVPNLSGAPPHHLHPQPPHPTPSPPSKPSNDFSVNVNEDRPAEKHYAVHLHHEKADNRQRVSLSSGASSFPDSSTRSHQHGQFPVSSPNKCSPIDYFQKGQPLPPAFRLQQAYDSQSEAERRRISRLSQCHPTKELERRTEGPDADVLPPSDPDKLAALEQFDRQNLHGHGEEKESNSFHSDPKKLAALKQFDDQMHSVQVQNELFHSQEQALVQGDNLASDPMKLAKLRLFDDSNMKTSDDHSDQRDGEVLASDPRKLAALTQFDAADGDSHSASALPSAPDSNPHKLAALTQFDAGNCAPPASCKVSPPTKLKPVETAEDQRAQDTFPVSKLDYVVTSQREALEACMSAGPQPGPVMPQAFSLSASHFGVPVVAPASVTNTCQADSTLASASKELHVPAQVSSPTASSSDENLLFRQKNFFDMYNKALEQMDDDIDDDDNDDDENADFENGNEEHNNYYALNASHASDPAETHSPPVQGQVAGGRMDGHLHPVPTEQDESVLNYFKQKEQHYEKRFNKPQLSQC